MSTITKEWLESQISAIKAVGITDSNTLQAFEIALASLEAEPAIHRWRRVTFEPYGPYPWHYGNFIGFSKPVDGIEDEYYYAAPPAPVSVPDERYQHLSELYHAQEKRLFKLAQRIKGASFDKYAYSPSQAIDVLESAIFGEREDECRAAILHGADRPQNEPQNIPENIPATQFEPVADLYGLTSPTGSETSFTFDAVEARDFIDGGWSCQEYVELGRFQVSMLQGAENAESPTTMQTAPELDYSPKNAESPTGINQGKSEPVTTAYKMPEGWVAVPVEPTEDMIVNGLESEPNESFSDEKVWEAYDAMSGCQQAAHRAKLCWAAMISAAPKPDVR
ncbi:hypothetical protein N6B07_002641 [Enterobacter hormaechei]|nr:hypothetical protein [Enterobacter hormaechei]EKW0707961.1 hypothetical protein [Enterobacter hormaechei]EKW0720997.1 hypothetical protein [Enterobacter hormaechei]ELY2044697.1 hypothetical protein [Enterobacter hormaechei]